VYGVPFGSSTGLDPITQGLDPVTQGVVTKRSADADAAVLYGAYGYPYANAYAHAYVPFGSSSGLDPITQGLDASTQGYAPYYGYYGKRSADAEADAGVLYGAYGYAGLPYAGHAAYGAYPYAYGAHPYVYGVPFGSSTGLDPITQGLDPVTQGVVTKRSADADAAVLYGAYGYPYANAYAHAYVPFGSSSGLDPITQGLDASTQGYAPYAYGYGFPGYAYGK